MPKFNEMPARMQFLIVAGGVIALTLAAWFFIYQPLSAANATTQASVDAKNAENERLRAYEPKLAEMNKQIEGLKEQLERLKKIVPDEKLADEFMHEMQDTAGKAGIEIRRYTAKQVNTKDFYTEAPYELELDGPYYSMLNFFERVGKLERIINVGGLKVATVAKGGDAGARHHYDYAPSETVVATCTTTTFFSRDNFSQPGAASAPAPAPAPAPAKK
jgi:type IV pilus assembly protein PilO